MTSNSTYGYSSKETQNTNLKRYLHLYVHCSIIYNTNIWKCSSIVEWIKKLWYIYTVEYYSAIKRDQILPYAMTRMDLEAIMLSEINQTKKNTIWFHLYEESKLN